MKEPDTFLSRISLIKIVRPIEIVIAIANSSRTIHRNSLHVECLKACSLGLHVNSSKLRRIGRGPRRILTHIGRSFKNHPVRLANSGFGDPPSPPILSMRDAGI